MDRKFVGIEVHPNENPPSKSAVEQKDKDTPEKLKGRMNNYKYNWRIDMLSKPTKVTPKADIKAKERASQHLVHPSVLKYQCSMRLDHLARPPIR